MPRAQVPHARPGQPDHYSSRAYWALRKQVKREEPTCWLCGQPWDPAAAPRTPRSFSLDHVTPLSHGGSLTDRANARAACLGCNSARGNTTRRPAAATRRPVVDTTVCAGCARTGCRLSLGNTSRCW